jgi:peptidoglycan hydrolase-like protein with peptidoglycan-binding domain
MSGIAIATVRIGSRLTNNKEEPMKRAVQVFVLAAATGLCLSPAWSQMKKEAPTDRNPTQPGVDQNMPPAAREFGANSTMSKDDIRKIEEALQAKGHNPGRVDGVLDNDTRTAIRAFQKANNLSQTGTVDNETAKKLGVTLSQQSGDKTRSSTDRPRSGSDAGYSGQVKPGDDQSVAPGAQSPRSR